MGDRNDRDAQPGCHISQRLERPSHICVLVTVGFSKIARYRVDDDKTDVTNPFDGAFKQRQVGLQIEGATTLSVALRNSGNQMNRARVGAGGVQPWANSISRIIFG